MLMEQERILLVEYGKKLVHENLTRGTGGNLSIFDRAAKTIAITPSGLDYFEVSPEDMVVIDIDGKILDGSRKPSSEWPMHTSYYKARPDINAVCHSHPVYCVTLSALRWELPAVDYLVAVAGDTKVRCAEYASFGSPELAVNAVKVTGQANAVLLANHGLNTIGVDLPSAFSSSVILEMMAEIYLRAKSVGEPHILPDKEMQFMLEKFKTYGQ